MCRLKINGGRKLSGSIAVQGAKNSVLPILAATVLCDGVSVIHGCPALLDVDSAAEILKYTGCKVKREGNTVTVDASNVLPCEFPGSLMHRMRSSITFLGALTARCKRIKMSSPGGCELGPRPIDLHIKGLRELNIKTEEYGGFIETAADDILGNDIHLDFPSVGATENIMLAAVLAKGKTTINNAAKEPEIWDLQCFLKKMGAKISGAGTDRIEIEGVKKLGGAEHTVIPDRIVASTYLCAAAMCGGKIELRNIEPLHINSVLSVLKQTGTPVTVNGKSVLLESPERLSCVDMIRTMPYPGFPTDAQAAASVMLSVADGTSVILENIFENRFKHLGELGKMGADIKMSGKVAVIRGVKELYGASVSAMELRGGAALVCAGCRAHGETQVLDIEHIERGYADIAADLSALGADICRIGQ